MEIIYINKIKENKNGSATVDITYCTTLPKLIKKHYKKIRCTKKLIERFIIEGLENHFKE